MCVCPGLLTLCVSRFANVCVCVCPGLLTCACVCVSRFANMGVGVCVQVC